MQGRITKEITGWKYVVDIGRDPKTGKRQRKSRSGFRTKKECDIALNELLMALQQNTFIEQNKMSLADYLTYWLENYVALNVAQTTLIRYKLSCKDIKYYIGKIELCQLKPLHIQKLYAELVKKGQSNSTILKTHRTLHLALKHAIGWQMINSNPTDLVKAPRPIKNEMKVWSIETAKEFLTDIREETIYIPVMMALQTGMREGEICALRWSDINFVNSQLSVKNTIQRINREFILKNPKTKKSRRNISLAASTIKELKIWQLKQLENKLLFGKDYIKNDFVCTWQNGSVIDPHFVCKKFPDVIDKYNNIYIEKNIKENILDTELKYSIIRFHDMRHTHATILLQQGVNPKIVSERLGHSTIAITLDTYSHVLPNMQKEVAEQLNTVFS